MASAARLQIIGGGATGARLYPAHGSRTQKAKNKARREQDTRSGRASTEGKGMQEGRSESRDGERKRKKKEKNKERREKDTRSGRASTEGKGMQEGRSESRDGERERNRERRWRREREKAVANSRSFCAVF